MERDNKIILDNKGVSIYIKAVPAEIAVGTASDLRGILKGGLDGG